MKEITRELLLEDGQKVYFKTGPIHPFWRINFAQGSVPGKLAGQYTYFDDAVRAVKDYLESRPKRNRTTTTKDVKESVKE